MAPDSAPATERLVPEVSLPREPLDDLDFTQEQGVYPISALQVGKDYDPRPQEDSARRTIAYLLIGLLWVIVGGILILLAFGSIGVGDLQDFAVILGPVVALVSAATGFYYGTKSPSRPGT